MNAHIEHWWDDNTGHLVHNIYQWTALGCSRCLCGDNLTTNHLRDSPSVYICPHRW